MMEEKLYDHPRDPNIKIFWAHASFFLIKCAELMLEIKPVSCQKLFQLRLIDIDTFSYPGVAVPYNINQDIDKYYYLFVEPTHTWGQIFMKFLNQENDILK